MSGYPTIEVGSRWVKYGDDPHDCEITGYDSNTGRIRLRMAGNLASDECDVEVFVDGFGPQPGPMSDKAPTDADVASKACQFQNVARVRAALKAYKDAQHRQGAACVEANKARSASANADYIATANGRDLAVSLRIRAEASVAASSRELAASEVFSAAADLIEALDAAGFGS